MATSSLIASFPLSPSPYRNSKRIRSLSALSSQIAYFPSPLSSRFERSQAPMLLRRGGRRHPSRSLRVEVVAAVQSNFFKVVRTIWRVAKDGIEAGTNLVPDSVPKPVARIGVAGVAVMVTLFLLKSLLSTAFFVLAMMGLIYFTFIALNTDEASGGSGSGSTTTTEDETLEEARRIMEKYK